MQVRMVIFPGVGGRKEQCAFVITSESGFRNRRASPIRLLTASRLAVLSRDLR